MEKSVTKQTQCNFLAEISILKAKMRHKSIQVNSKSRTLDKAIQTIMGPRPKCINSITQTRPVKFLEPKPKTYQKNESTQTKNAELSHKSLTFVDGKVTRDNVSVQTDVFDIFHSLHEEEKLVNLIQSIKTPEQVFSIIVEKCLNLNLDLKFRRNILGERTVTVSNTLNFGLIQDDLDPAYAVFRENGKTNLHLIFQTVRVLDLSPSNSKWEDDLKNVLNIINGKNYVYCPGIKFNGNERIPVRTTLHKHPFMRLQSDSCPVWYTSDRKFTKRIVKCVTCNKSTNSMAKTSKRKLEETPIKELKRRKINSRCPFINLTPEARLIRLRRISHARTLQNHRIKKLESQLARRNILLGDSQSEELTTITEIINRDPKDKVDEA